MLASGLPVAAFPVTGPRDVIGTAPVGALDDDLQSACLAALSISRHACLDFAKEHTWQASARAFLDNLVTAGDVEPNSEAVLGMEKCVAQVA